MPNLLKTIAKLREYEKLEEGWYFGSGVPLDKEKIESAVILLMEGFNNGVERFNVFPSEDGSVMVSFYAEDYVLDLSLEIDNTVTCSKDLRGEQVEYNEGLTLQSAFTKIWNFSQQIDILESSTLSTGTASSDALRVQRFHHHRRTTESQSSRSDVQTERVNVSANTFLQGIKNSREHLQCFG